MNILGIYGAINWNSRNDFDPHSHEPTYVHDSGATLIKDGKHICSIDEERLSRIKYDGNFPIKSIEYCLSLGNVKKEEIDLVCFPSMCLDIFYKQLEDNLLHKKLNELFPNAKVKIVSHHLSHASSSIFSCNFNEGTFFTLDGAGTAVFDAYKRKRLICEETNSIGYFNKNHNILRFYPGIPDANNFGSYYQLLSSHIYERKMNKLRLSEVSQHLLTSSCGKIMGLSAYGNYKQYEWKDYRLSQDYALPFISFNPGFIDDTNYFNDIYSFKSPEDMSSILQKNFESALLDYLTALKKSTHLSDNVCFAGGCFLNVLANTVIKKSNLFEKVHIPPYTNDSGLHFGAACYGAFLNKEKVTLANNLSLVGKEYTDSEILTQLKKYSTHSIHKEYQSFEELCKIVSSLLHQNKIIGWFQNRSEFGRRALGSRSLLMNPTPKKNKDIMNLRVKHREYWRPFAGIILEDYFHEYFEENFTSDYMLYSFKVKEDKMKNLCAIMHVDNTCRVQTVNEELNPQITKLLREYKKISRIPVLLNTSFNDSGEPIVETPEDAIKAFLKLDIDYLVIGNYLVNKKKTSKYHGFSYT
jgi:carbamoyltransferase